MSAQEINIFLFKFLTWDCLLYTTTILSQLWQWNKQWTSLLCIVIVLTFCLVHQLTKTIFCMWKPTDLLKCCSADMKLLHRPWLHWPADQSITLVTTKLTMLEDQRILFLLCQSIALLWPHTRTCTQATHRDRTQTKLLSQTSKHSLWMQKCISFLRDNCW